jgi:cytochrome o ubiquinol oxidase subunit 2
LKLLLPLVLAGCSYARFPLFNPYGSVANTQWRYTILDVVVMMLIIGPVTLFAIVLLWRYRQTRRAAYDPNWSHSMPLELAMWGIPILVVTYLGWASYHSTLLVNPYGPKALNMNDPANPPLDVQVITTDWQWIFIYPQYGIATIDDLPIPAGRPIRLALTSTSVTNDFFIPQVAPMIDVMPGMRTMDAFEVDHPAQFVGYSADFSGEGFSWMQFQARVMAPADFAHWVAQTTASPSALTYPVFQKIAQPTVNVGAKPSYFSHVDPGLFQHVYDDARSGVVYAIRGNYQISVSQVDYTQGKNATQ